MGATHVCFATFDPVDPREVARKLESYVQEHLDCGVEVLLVDAADCVTEPRRNWGEDTFELDEHGDYVPNFENLICRLLLKLYKVERKRQFIILEFIVGSDVNIGGTFNLELPKLLWTFEPKFGAISEVWPDALETVIETILEFTDGGDPNPCDIKVLMNTMGLNSVNLPLSRAFHRLFSNPEATPDLEEFKEKVDADFLQKMQDMDHVQILMLLDGVMGTLAEDKFSPKDLQILQNQYDTIRENQVHGCEIPQMWEDDPESMHITMRCLDPIFKTVSKDSRTFNHTPERTKEFQDLVSNVVDFEALDAFVGEVESNLRSVLPEIIPATAWKARWKISKKQIEEESNIDDTVCVIS